MENQRYKKVEKFFEVPVMISVLMLIPVLIIEYSQQFDWKNVLQKYYLPNVEEVIARHGQK